MSGLAVRCVIAHLEREYGQARLLEGEERQRTAEALGVWNRCAVIDCGDGLLATVGPRGGGLLVHDLRGGLLDELYPDGISVTLLPPGGP